MKPTPEQREAFGSRLRALRDERSLTLQQVVDALRPRDGSLTVAKLSAWERAEYGPRSRESIDLLEEFFGVDGELHMRFGSPAAQPSQIEALEARVADLEARVAALEPVRPKERHLRAASSRKGALDPGAPKRGTTVRPVAADPEP